MNICIYRERDSASTRIMREEKKKKAFALAYFIYVQIYIQTHTNTHTHAHTHANAHTYTKIYRRNTQWEGNETSIEAVGRE